MVKVCWNNEEEPSGSKIRFIRKFFNIPLELQGLAMMQSMCTGQPGIKNRAQAGPFSMCECVPRSPAEGTDKAWGGKGSLRVGSPSLEWAVSTRNSESKDHKSVHTEGLLQRLGAGLGPALRESGAVGPFRGSSPLEILTFTSEILTPGTVNWFL